ncbi:hypothetical protein M422DRAFT_246768 [Sphaerobolus stellatus SS14]|nr:hypothetical protein M422DRAFT_246768 [Sphaerobolus stellatus SS14]
MEVEIASVSSHPSRGMYRVSRNGHASFAEVSHRSGEQGRPAQFTSQFRHSPHYPGSQTTSEDEFGLDGYDTNTRLLSASLPPADSSVPNSDTTHRLKALLERFDNTPRTPMAFDKTNMPPTPSEDDSDVDARSTRAVRASIRSLIDDALREPGSTPQKSRLTRRASFNMSGSPKVDKGKRKSNSDEDPEVASKYPGEQASSSALSLDRLRLQFNESVSQTQDSHASTSALPSEITEPTPKKSTQSRSSRIPVQHSPIVHVRSHKDLEPFSAVRVDDSESSPIKPNRRTSHVVNRNSTRDRSPSMSSTSRESEHSHERARTPTATSAPRSRTPTTALRPSENTASGRISPNAWPTPPPPGSSPSRVKSYRRSFKSDPTSEDDISARGGSVTSDADYEERHKEDDRSRQHELERSWDRPHSRQSQSRPHLTERFQNPSHTVQNGISSSASQKDDIPSSRSTTPMAEGYFAARGQSHSSAARSHSPSDSLRSNEEEEEEHMRERNWNTPKWQLQHSHRERDAHTSQYGRASPSFSPRERRSDVGSNPSTSPSSVGVPESRRTLRPERSTDSSRHHTKPRSTSPVSPPHSATSPPLTARSNQDGKFVSSINRSSSSSPVLSRPTSRTSNFGSIGRSGRHDVDTREIERDEILVASAGSSIDHARGHRRTVTELSEPTGAYPKQNFKVSSILLPEAEDSDASLFANESIPPPQTSTPPLNATDLPDFTISPVPSDIPLPDSPAFVPASPRRKSTGADLARFQKAIAPSFVFPKGRSSPPTPTPASPRSLETPRKQQLESSSHPEVSSTDDQTSLRSLSPESEQGLQTPARIEEEKAKVPWSLLKTPRPPGAFGTPYPNNNRRDEHYPTEEPPNPANETGRFGMQGVSLMMTPAPPGAFKQTPASTRLRGILKVRFDGDREVDGESVKPNAGLPPDGPSSLPSPSSGEVPLNLSPSRRHKLRMVDEYGRVRRFTEAGEEIVLDRKGAPSLPINGADDTTLTPRRRAKMRQVDAFGNEITETDVQKEEIKPKAESNDKGSISKRKKGAYSHIAKSLEELQKELAEEEHALSSVLATAEQPDNGRLVDLATVSKTARVERDKLAQKLQHEKSAEGDLTSGFFVARNLRRLPSAAEISGRTLWWHRKWRMAVIIILLEIILLIMGYRLAFMHAKYIWLKTYFDPFFPALYVYKARPSLLNRFGALPLDWSVFAISDGITHVGLGGFLSNVGRRIWDGLRLDPWDGWGSSAAGPPIAWPS